MTTEVLSRVFVYGTLKKGEPNHNWLTDVNNGWSKLISDGVTVKKYPLIIASRYNIPFLLDAPEKGNNVQGEVYEVDQKMMGNLDILEDHPDIYVRRQEEIRLGSQVELCWTYFLMNYKPDLIKKQFLVSYSSKGSHNLPYCERISRDLDPALGYKHEVLKKSTI